MPATWASMGVDGDHDRRADIHNDADSIYSAADYLTKSGVSKALQVFGRRCSRTTRSTGTSTMSCSTPPATAAAPCSATQRRGPASGSSESFRRSPTIASRRCWLGQRPRRRLLPHGRHRPERLGLLQLHQAAYRIGIRMPARLRATQLAGRRKRHPDPARQERPGDLIFWDSYLGPNQIGHVMIVWNQQTKPPSRRAAPVQVSATSATPTGLATTSSRSGASETSSLIGDESFHPTRDDGVPGKSAPRADHLKASDRRTGS